MAFPVPEGDWLEVVSAWRSTATNGKIIATLAVANNALYNAFGRDAPNTPEFKKNMDDIKRLTDEIEATKRKYGGYIPTAGYVMPNPDFSQGINDTSEGVHAKP